MLVGLLAVGVLGVVVMTGEYTSGLVRCTLVAVPRRPLVLAAKAAVFGAVTLITGEVAAFLAFFTGGAALGHGITPPALGQPGVLRAVTLTGACLCLAGLLGLGLGAIIRHTAAAVAVLVGAVYVGELLAGRLWHAAGAYLLVFIVADLHSATRPVCRPGASSCPLPAWAGSGCSACTPLLPCWPAAGCSSGEMPENEGVTSAGATRRMGDLLIPSRVNRAPNSISRT